MFTLFIFHLHLCYLEVYLYASIYFITILLFHILKNNSSFFKNTFNMKPRDNPEYQEKLRMMNKSQRKFRFKSSNRESAVGSRNNGVVST